MPSCWSVQALGSLESCCREDHERPSKRLKRCPSVENPKIPCFLLDALSGNPFVCVPGSWKLSLSVYNLAVFCCNSSMNCVSFMEFRESKDPFRREERTHGHAWITASVLLILGTLGEPFGEHPLDHMLTVPVRPKTMSYTD